MRIAIAQIQCAPGSAESNIAHACSYCSRAKKEGAELVVLPEMVDTGYDLAVAAKTASGWDVGPLSALRETAQKESICIACGLSERDKGDLFNSLALIDARGAIAAKYRKTHLFFGPGIDERSCFRPGAELTSAAVEGVRMGLSICYDLRFPEMFRVLAVKHQVQAFINCSAWPFPRVSHFSCLLRARAIENQCYMIAANRVGKDGHAVFCGSSVVIDPFGATVACASEDREELILADLSAEVLQAARQRMPVLNHRREDLY